MRILLLGYGKMGKAIEKLAVRAHHTISGKIEEDNKADLARFSAKNTDVAIEFSQPDAAFNNIRYCLENSIPVVSGTTGWLEKKPVLDEICLKNKGAFFYASNFSIGVNLFFDLNEKLARLMRPFNYYVTMEEIHHTEKKDEPSGTAITLAEGIVRENKNFTGWHLGNGEEDKISINAKREGQVPGTHSVKYNSTIDDIEIKHTAHSREGFAKGALSVAKWMVNKKGVLSMKDFLKTE